MRAVDHDGRRASNRVLGYEVANVVDRWEDYAAVRGQHEVVHTATALKKETLPSFRLGRWGANRVAEEDVNFGLKSRLRRGFQANKTNRKQSILRIKKRRGNRLAEEGTKSTNDLIRDLSRRDLFQLQKQKNKTVKHITDSIEKLTGSQKSKNRHNSKLVKKAVTEN